MINNNLITIGNSVWTNYNLNVKHFNNDDPIREVFSVEEILYCEENKISCFCYYQFDNKNADFGLFYNWYAVTDPRGLAPKGFRVSTVDDAEQMYHNLKKLNKRQYDDQTLESDILFNSQGFQPNAAGYLSTEEGLDSDFDDIQKRAWYWTSSKFIEGDDQFAPVFHFFASDLESDLFDADLINFSLNDISGETVGSLLSVRCVQEPIIENSKSVSDLMDEFLMSLKTI